jgi:hypothetical protein
MERTGGESGIAITQHPGGAGQRCAVCGQRGAPRFRLMDDTQPAVDRPERVLCEACADAVRQEIARADLRTPHRIEIATGIVAAHRGPASRYPIWSDQYWDSLDADAESRLMRRFIIAVAILKTIVFIAVAFIVTVGH